MNMRLAVVAALLVSACGVGVGEEELAGAQSAELKGDLVAEYDTVTDDAAVLRPACSGTLGCKYASCLADCQTPDRLSTQYCDNLCHCIVYEEKSKMQCEFESPYIDIREDPGLPDKELTEPMPADSFDTEEAECGAELEPFVAACSSQGGALSCTSEQAACCTLCDAKEGCSDVCIDAKASEPMPAEVTKEWDVLTSELDSSSTRLGQQTDHGPDGCKLVCGKIFWPACSIIVSQRKCLDMAGDCYLECRGWQ